MATNIELRRYDYGSTAVVKRTAITTDQSTITSLELNVDKLDGRVNRDVYTIPYATRLPELTDIGNTDSQINLLGTLTATGTVDPAWLLDDLIYASVNWWTDGSTDQTTTLWWKENAIASSTAWISGTDNADQSFVITGLIKTVTFTRTGGEPGQIAFGIIFEMGT